MKQIICLLTLVLFSYSSYSQHGVQFDTDHAHTGLFDVTINQDEYVEKLTNLYHSLDKKDHVEIKLPVSPSQLVKFEAYPTYLERDIRNMEYPDIQTFKIYSKEKGYADGRITVSPDGVWAYINSDLGMFSIARDFEKSDPHAHFLEFGHNASDPGSLITCEVSQKEMDEMPSLPSSGSRGETGQFGNVLRKYVYAVMTTGEYYRGNGNNNSSVTAIITQGLNGINMFYERDLGITFLRGPVMLRDDPVTDNLNPNGSRTQEAGREINAEIGCTPGYDIGEVWHKMTSGGSGVAGLRAVCQGTPGGNSCRKAEGWSGMSSNTSTAWLGLMGHEVGHQCGAPHTFNDNGGPCETNISTSTSYEIGSGTTIMSYNGSGCAHNIPPSGAADNYFHANSIDLMSAFLGGTDCATIDSIDNSAPVVQANSCGVTYIIPKETPFKLEGVVDDRENTNLTYIWEQYDEDGPGKPTTGLVGNAAASRATSPIFRSYPPSRNGITRYFPRLTDYINEVSNDFEVLSRVARIMRFRLIARDNNPDGGGVGWDQLQVEVGRFGPLELTYPNGGETVGVDQTIPYTWDTKGSDAYCGVVDILLSIDGGKSFVVEIAKGVDYAAGTALVSIPKGITDTDRARVMIKCTDTECVQFFEVSDGNFTINSNCKAESSNICPSDPLLANSGDAALELNLNKLIGNTASSFVDSITTASPQMVAAVGLDIGGCSTVGNLLYESRIFSVTANGNYSFQLDPDSINASLVNVYVADEFDPNNPCQGWVGSSAIDQGSGFIPLGFVTVSLNSCTDYLMTFHRNQPYVVAGSVISINGPGDVISAGANGVDDDLMYTFLAVDAVTDSIVAIAADSDFKTLEAGTYYVVGVSYLASGDPDLLADPSQWLTLDVSQLFLRGECLSISNNNMPLEVLSSCAADSVSVGLQTPCDSDRNIYTQELTLYLDRYINDFGPGDSIVINDQAFFIGPDETPGAPYDITVVLEGLLADALNVDLLVEFKKDKTCFRNFPNVFLAPENCCDIAVDLPEEVSVCEGDEVILDAGSGGVEYIWVRNNDTISMEQVIEAPVTGIYKVKITNDFGCFVNYEVDVTHLRFPNLEIDKDISFVCDNKDLDLTTFRNNARDSTFWYKDFDFDNPIEEDRSTITVSEGGWYHVIVYNELGCESRDSIEVTIVPGVDISLAEEGPDIAVICEDIDSLFVVQGGDPSYLYEWWVEIDDQGANPFWALVQGATADRYILSGEGRYRVFALSPNGCFDGDTVNINTQPVPTVFADPQEDFFCSNSTIRVDLTSNYGQFYVLLKDGISTGDTTQNPFYFFDISEPGEYSVYTQSADNAGACPAVSEPFTITSRPAAEISGTDYWTPCPGDDVVFDLVSDGNYTYVWTLNGDTIPETSLNFNATTYGNGDYILYATTGDECVTPFPVTVLSVDAPVVAFDAPPNNTTICDNEEVTLTLRSNLSEVSWFLNNIPISNPDDVSVSGTVNGNGERTYEYTVSAGGTYTAMGTNNQGCDLSAERVIVTNESAKIELGPDITACDAMGLQIELTADIDLNTTSFIRWRRDGTINPVPPLGTFTSVTNLETGQYTVTVSYNGCESYDTVNVVIEDNPMLSVTTDPINTSFCGALPPVTITANTNLSTINWTYNSDPLNITGNVVTDAQAGTYTVQGIDGDCMTSIETIVVEQNSIPVIEAGTYPPVCKGTEIPIEVTTDGNYTYTWYINNSLESSITGTSFIIPDDTEAGIYEYRVEAGPVDCSATDMFTIEILDSPTVSIEASPSESICTGETVTITATSEANTVIWYYNDQLDASLNGKEITVSAAGKYTAEVGGANCSDTDELTITEVPGPTATLDATYSGCANQDLIIDLNPDGMYTYEWSVNSSLDAGQTGSTYTLNRPAGDYTISVVVNPGQSCALNLSTEVTIVDASTLVLSADPESICTGETTTLTADTDLTVTWYLDNVAQTDLIGTTVTVDKGGTWRAVGAEGTDCAVEDEVFVSETDGPEFTLQDTYGGCEGSPITIDLMPTGSYTYEWTVNSTLSTKYTGSSILFDEPEGIYELGVTVTLGSCVIPQTSTVNVISSPQVTLSADDDVLCSGAETTLTADTDLSAITWFLGNMERPDLVGKVVTVNEAGTWRVVVDGGGACTAEDEVEISAGESPEFTLLDSYGGCVGQPINIDVDPQSNYTYEWFVNGEPSSKYSGFNILFDEAQGDYDVELIARSGECTTTQSTTINIIDAPTVSLEASALEFCSSDLVTLTATSAINVTWYLNDEEQIDLIGNTIDVNQAGVWEARVDAGLDCEASDNVELTSFDSPSISMNDNYVTCAGNAIDIDLAPGGVYDYSWSVNGTTSSTLDGAVISFSDEVGVYEIEVVATIGVCSTTLSSVFEITDAPTIELSADKTELCVGELVTITANTTLDVKWLLDDIEQIDQQGSEIITNKAGVWRAEIDGGPNCKANDEITINYYDVPEITLDANYEVCANQVLTLNTNPTGDYSFVWSIDNAVVNDVTTEELAFSEDAGIYEVTVVATEINGVCSETITTTVNVISSDPVIVSADKTELCSDEIAILTAQTNAATVNWFKDNIIISGQNNLTLEVTETGLYRAEIGTGTDCLTSDEINILVNEVPEFTVDPAVVVGCLGDNPVITVNASSSYDYEWQLGGQTIMGANSSTYTVTESGIYTVIASSGDCTTSAEVVATLETPIEVSLDEDQALCVGDIYTILAETNATSVNWYFENVLIDGVNSLSYEATESGTYTVETMTANNCTSTDEIFIDFMEIPVIDFGAGEIQFCEGDINRLEVDASSVNTIEWTRDDVPVGTGSSIVVTEEGYYEVTITTPAMCTNTDGVWIFITPIIEVELGDDIGFCEGESIPLSSNVPGDIYEWQRDGTTISDEASITPTITGTYTLIVSTLSGCSGSDNVVVTINPLPNATVEDVVLCAGQTQTVTTSEPFSSYQWSTGASSVSTTFEHDNNTDDDITVTASVDVEDVNGCANTFSFEVTSLAPIMAQLDRDYYGVCPGESVDLGVTGGDIITWIGDGLDDNNSANPNASPTTTTIYTVEVANSACPDSKSEASVEVEVFELGERGILTLDTCVFKEQEFELISFGGFKYDWEPRENIVGLSYRDSAAIITVEEDTVLFTVTIEDQNGCETNHQVEICPLVDPDGVINPVTIISPNGDGMNDELRINGLEAFPDNEITIFNRWGNIIYEARGYQTDGRIWDGTRDGEVLPPDTYYYILKFGAFTYKKSITIVKE